MIERLYIHVPFCAKTKCAYCAFYSEKFDPKLESAYIAKLSEEFKKKNSLCGKLKSIYIGGGTPTALSTISIDKIFSLIEKNFRISENCEISIESNPETLTKSKMSVIANFANRISLGIQSFDSLTRKIIGRECTDCDIRKAIRLIQKSGIKNFSCDLINSVPRQTLESCKSDLIRAIDAGVNHLSSYSLTIEEGTELANKKIKTDKDLEVKVWEMHDKILSQYGFKRYEISNFAKRGYQCKHNLEIWFGDKYLGIGPAASSFDGEKRWTEIANFAKWLNGAAPEYDIIEKKKRAGEILAFGFRTSKKWTDKKFFKRTSFHLNEWSTVLEELQKYGLIKYKENYVVSKKKGLMLWNTVAEMIITHSSNIS